MSETLPLKTHNLPSLADALAPAVVVALIEAETSPLKQRETELQDGAKRFLAAHKTIADDETDGKVTEFLSQVQRFTADSGRIESTRVAFKAPVLAAAQSIDKAFKAIGAQLIARPVRQRRAPFNLIEQIINLSIAYKDAKEEKVRAEAQKIADEKAAQAAAAEKLASAGSGVVTFEDAAGLFDEADKAQAVADAPAADLTRTRGSDFGMSSARKVRVVTIVNPAEVDRIYCVPDQVLLNRAAGKAGDLVPTLKGCTVADVSDLTVRR
jgi:hypothetical protein